MATPLRSATGATGNVGRHIVTQLRAAGMAVRAMSRDRASSRYREDAVTGDLTSPDSIRDAAAGADAAFLLWPFLYQLDTFTDARVERYWQLLAVINSWPAPSSVVPVFDWLIAALRVS